MKSVPGLILAIGLGLIGAVFNWMYLHGGPNREAVAKFVAVKDGRTLNRGDILRDSDLTLVEIPEVYVGNLRTFAVLDKAQPTVVGVRVGRTLTGPCLLLQDDLTTPKEKLPLEPDEDAVPIAVDSRTFVPSLYEPGDTVSFLIPRVPAPRWPRRAIRHPATRPDKAWRRSLPRAPRRRARSRPSDPLRSFRSATNWAASK